MFYRATTDTGISSTQMLWEVLNMLAHMLSEILTKQFSWGEYPWLSSSAETLLCQALSFHLCPYF